MFFSSENLVHVCLEQSHGTLCYFEPDKCWFAASEETALELGKRGLKFHFIPKSVFKNANLIQFACDYKDDKKTE
jgi:uroporphyrinogen-III synthase